MSLLRNHNILCFHRRKNVHAHPLPLLSCCSMPYFSCHHHAFLNTEEPCFYILQHFSENVFTLVSPVFTVCSNTYKPTDFRAKFYLPCIPMRIASNRQRLLHPVLYEYCLLSTTAGPVACNSWSIKETDTKKQRCYLKVTINCGY